MTRPLAALVLCALIAPLAAQSTPATAPVSSAATAPISAKVWLGRAAEIEDYLRTAEIIKIDETAQGVTHPKKATLKPGGPVAMLAFKAIPSGTYDEGFRESYKAEIAAYEVDKLIRLDMVPPT